MINDPLLPRAGVSDLGDGRARWCVWAPRASRVELVLDPGAGSSRRAMERLERGFHVLTAERGRLGRRYAYSLDGGDPRPDPASRWQPEGVGGPSAVVFPEAWTWDEDG